MFSKSECHCNNTVNCTDLLCQTAADPGFAKGEGGRTMASARIEREPKRGPRPQRGPGAEPLMGGGQGGAAP